MELNMKECIRCGNEPLKDFKCTECGSYGLMDVDEGGCDYDNKSGKLFDLTTGPDGGDIRDQVICECGCKSFDIEYNDYCGYCAGRE